MRRSWLPQRGAGIWGLQLLARARMVDVMQSCEGLRGSCAICSQTGQDTMRERTARCWWHERWVLCIADKALKWPNKWWSRFWSSWRRRSMWGAWSSKVAWGLRQFKLWGELVWARAPVEEVCRCWHSVVPKLFQSVIRTLKQLCHVSSTDLDVLHLQTEVVADRL